jgi:proteic killer suppression protein
VIKTFRHKGLKELFETGRTSKINKQLQAKTLRILDALNRAKKPQDMNIPGYDFHALKGFNPTRYTTHVNGPWCVTFEFDGDGALKVDFEQYH